jgi:hypothetical protein
MIQPVNRRVRSIAAKITVSPAAQSTKCQLPSLASLCEGAGIQTVFRVGDPARSGKDEQSVKDIEPDCPGAVFFKAERRRRNRGNQGKTRRNEYNSASFPARSDKDWSRYAKARMRQSSMSANQYALLLRANSTSKMRSRKTVGTSLAVVSADAVSMVLLSELM